MRTYCINQILKENISTGFKALFASGCPEYVDIDKVKNKTCPRGVGLTVSANTEMVQF